MDMVGAFLYGMLGYLGSPVFLVLMIIGFLYAGYKYLYKKEDLTKTEWIIIAVLIVLFAVGLLNFL